MTSRPDRWPLRPGDLPPDRVLAREPRLRDLEENAVYRAMLFRIRGNPWLRMAPFVRGLILGLLILPVIAFFGATWPLILIVVMLLRRRPRDAAARLMLPEPLLDEFLDLPLNTRDWTLAYWGFSLSPCGRTVGGWVAFVYVTIVLLSLIATNRLLGGPDGGLYEAMLLFPTSLIVAVAVGVGLLPPQAWLPVLAGRLRAIRRELLRSVGLWGWVSGMIGGIFFAIALVVTISVIVGLAVYAAIAGSNALGPDIWDRLDKWLWHPATPAASILLGVACGAASVGLWRLYADAVFERRLDAMDREFERILRHLRFRRDPSEFSGD